MQLLRKGKFIVIEGIDQSGKKTQSILLRNRLKKNGYKVGYISFPKYNTSIGKLVKKCLHDDSFSLEMIVAFRLNARERTRTSTGFYSHQHLKLTRLPIPPLALRVMRNCIRDN